MVLEYVYGKGNDEYLTDKISIPEKSYPKYRIWKTKNHMVLLWLINSMTTEVGENFLLNKIAKEKFGDTSHEKYSSSELFEVETRLHNLRQGDLNVTQYFYILTRYW